MAAIPISPLPQYWSPRQCIGCRGLEQVIKFLNGDLAGLLQIQLHASGDPTHAGSCAGWWQTVRTKVRSQAAQPSGVIRAARRRVDSDRPPQPWPDLHGDRREARCGTKHSRQVHPAGQAPASRRTHITFVGHVFLNQRQCARRNSAAKPPQSIAETIELGTNEYTKRPTTNSSKGTLNTHATTELESPRGSNSVGMVASVCIKSPTMAPPNTGPV